MLLRPPSIPYRSSPSFAAPIIPFILPRTHLMPLHEPELPAGSQLSHLDHRRDIVGMTYVYPVVSRRAGGVSVGINLNPNNACNWHCLYCQVPQLTRGSAPPIDLPLLEQELKALLEALIHGDFMAKHVPDGLRHIQDIALSGNGEPTSAREFPEVIECVARLRNQSGLNAPLRLITNGSLLHQPRVQEGIACLGHHHGEVWFKLDAGTRHGMQRINGADLDPAGVIERLSTCARLCDTWVQTCCITLDGQTPDATETDAWLEVLRQASLAEAGNHNPQEAASQHRLIGVHLYGLARPSMQEDAHRLGSAPRAWMEALAARVRQLGLSVRVSP
jgi:wyosine [tRNA(Phe)-imidazoG37] synthetase (radical SAM superfamily)